MKKKLFILPALMLTGILATSCSFNIPAIMRKSSGLAFTTKGSYNSMSTAVVATSYDNLVEIVSSLIAEEYGKFYISIGFARQNFTAEDLFLMTEIDAHLTTFSIEAYDANGNLVNNFNTYTKIQKNWILEYDVKFTNVSAASRHTTETKENTYYGQINGNMLLRMAKYDDRAEDFEDFPITQDNIGEFSVNNSEELWWSVEHGYIPKFNDTNSRAYAIYEAAKDICRKYIKDEMSDFEKILTIYDYITSNIAYDYDCLDDGSNWQNNVAYYLEGSFAYKKGVCDSFSKTFSLLAGIENLDVVRGFGYNYESGTIESGHAWNYASLDDGETWYLVCPTWGRKYGNLLDSNPDQVFMTDYSAAFTSYKYFSDNSSFDFSEKVWLEYNKSSSPLVVSALDTFTYGNATYNYQISSYDQLVAMVDEIYSLGVRDPYSLCLDNSTIDWKAILSSPKGSGEHTYKTQFKAHLTELGYESYYFFDTEYSYSEDTFTILIAK